MSFLNVRYILYRVLLNVENNLASTLYERYDCWLGRSHLSRYHISNMLDSYTVVIVRYIPWNAPIVLLRFGLLRFFDFIIVFRGYNTFIHIFQSCFTSSCQWFKHIEYGTIGWYVSITKYNKSQTECIFHVVNCIMQYTYRRWLRTASCDASWISKCCLYNWDK